MGKRYRYKQLKIFALLAVTFTSSNANAENENPAKPVDSYWDSGLRVNVWRLPPPPLGYKPRVVDLDGDGGPDIIYFVTKKDIPGLCINDYDDIKWNKE